jgi:chemotaxis protein histidine kinase CheA
MSTRVISQRRDPYETLERLLNKTTLTTQRVTHGNIIDVGDKVLSRTHVDFSAEREKAVAEALQIASRRHEQEMRQALEQSQQEAEKEKCKALAALRQSLEELAAAVAKQRQKDEDERVEKLRREWERKMNMELEAQQLEMERKKELAVEEALDRLRTQLKKEFALAKEREIAAALANAREKFKMREQETVARVRQECQAMASTEKEQAEYRHQQEVKQLRDELTAMEEKYIEEAEHRKLVECDFKDLQDDYKRFLDNTHGRFHSDYMMRLRFHGTQLPAQPDANELILSGSNHATEKSWKMLSPKPKLLHRRK